MQFGLPVVPTAVPPYLPHFSLTEFDLRFVHPTETAREKRERISIISDTEEPIKWNNPDKMSAEELQEDERGGITTQDSVPGNWRSR